MYVELVRESRTRGGNNRMAREDRNEREREREREGGRERERKGCAY